MELTQIEMNELSRKVYVEIREDLQHWLDCYKSYLIKEAIREARIQIKETRVLTVEEERNFIDETRYCIFTAIGLMLKEKKFANKANECLIKRREKHELHSQENRKEGNKHKG